MTMYGANPEQLTHLGTTLNRQIDSIGQVMAAVATIDEGTDCVFANGLVKILLEAAPVAKLPDQACHRGELCPAWARVVCCGAGVR